MGTTEEVSGKTYVEKGGHLREDTIETKTAIERHSANRFDERAGRYFRGFAFLSDPSNTLAR
jgi:hypothetical protein